MLHSPRMKNFRERSGRKVSISDVMEYNKQVILILTRSWCISDLLIPTFDLRYLLKARLYKNTLKPAIIRYTKVVCLHGKQTTGNI